MAQEEQQRPIKNKLLAQVQALDEAEEKKVILTRSRRSKVRPEFVGHTFGIFNGRKHSKVSITQDMVGKTLGKIAPKERPTACTKYLSIPQRKMRQVADLVSNMPVEKALNILNFTPKIAAVHLARALKSAVANKLSLEGTASLDPEDLHVNRITVDPAPTAKRIRFQSMGRVFRYRKRFCHLAVYLDERPQGEIEGRPKAARGKASDDKSEKKTAKKTRTKKAARKRTKATTPNKKAKVSTKRAGTDAPGTTGGGKQGSKRGR